MPPRRPHVVDLEWDENNERHIEEHIDPWLIQDLIEGGDWFAFRNYHGHPPEHRLLIGRTPAGVFVTAVLREPTWENPGVWRPITGWLSTDVERKRFQDEEKRTRSHHG
jgi:hypothetical protein